MPDPLCLPNGNMSQTGQACRLCSAAFRHHAGESRFGHVKPKGFRHLSRENEDPRYCSAEAGRTILSVR